jgi:hypothetical protein
LVKNKLWVLILIVIFLGTNIYANDFTDNYCGAWCQKNRKGEITASISVTRIDRNVYFVIYYNDDIYYDSEDNILANSFSFANYGFTKNQKIRIENIDYFGTQVFYELQLFEDSEELYVLCNHEELIYPWTETDYPFYRVDYFTEEEIKKEKKLEEQIIYENVIERLRQKK